MNPRASVRRLHGIYAIVNEGSPDPVALTRAVLAGGARIVQYRAKAGIRPQSARAIRALTRACGALFIVNDDPQAAIAYDADGVHVGPEDLERVALAQLGQLLGERILGVSCGTPEEARTAQAAGAAYVGTGAVFETRSKPDAGEPIGLEGLRAVVAATRLPVAAIGGIDARRLLAVRDAGAAMAAVISAIAASPQPQRATEELVRLWGSV